jgi:hypothetical protein
MWWLTGRYFDRLRGINTAKQQTTGTIVSATFGLAGGLLVLGAAIFWIQDYYFRNTSASQFGGFLYMLQLRPYISIAQLLFVFWSLTLISLNAKTIVSWIRRAPTLRSTPEKSDYR